MVSSGLHQLGDPKLISALRPEMSDVTRVHNLLPREDYLTFKLVYLLNGTFELSA